MSLDTKKAWRQANDAAHRKAMRRDRQRMRLRHRAFLTWLREGICRDCREWGDALELDHVRGPKLFDIGCGACKGRTWTQLIEEVMKCDLVCHACHKARTRSRSRAWRPGDVETPF